MNDKPHNNKSALPSQQASKQNTAKPRHTNANPSINTNIIKNHTNIVLTGFMASGKSTISRTLALRLGMFLIDTDEMIENHAKMTIPQIFAKHGEERFRALEKQLFESIKGIKGCVISTGGGFCPTQVDKLGTVVWLDAPLWQIIKRLAQSRQSRPKAAQADQNALAQLYNERKKIYAKSAHIRINTKSLNKGQIINQIIAKLQNNQ